MSDPTKFIDVSLVARMAHETNRAYCELIGDYSRRPWNEAPDWQKESALKGAQFHLAQLRNGTKPTPRASHESWLDQKRLGGWKYGPIKNEQTREHPCFLPYDQLPLEQRLKDYLFAGVVEAFFRASKESA